MLFSVCSTIVFSFVTNLFFVISCEFTCDNPVNRFVFFYRRNVFGIRKQSIGKRVFQTHTTGFESYKSKTTAHYAANNRDYFFEESSKSSLSQLNAKPFHNSLNEWVECAFRQNSV